MIAMIVSLEPELLERLSRLDAAAANTAAAAEQDAELAKAVRRTAKQRIVLYAVVLMVALFGQASGAVAMFHLPWPIAIGAVLALEVGGVVFLANADVRRRLGEHATGSRILAVVIAGAAITFNLIAHDDHLMGGFFALMSFLGFVAFMTDMENKRRDRLRAKGDLGDTTPAYELWGHWVKHPMLTRRAKGFAKAYPQLGLYGSLEAALIVSKQERRNAALSKALQKRLRKTVGKDMAEIAILTYDMDQVAKRLQDGADYDGLTAILAQELSAVRVGGHVAGREPIRAERLDVTAADPVPALTAGGTTDQTTGTRRSEVPVTAVTETPELTARTTVAEPLTALHPVGSAPVMPGSGTPETDVLGLGQGDQFGGLLRGLRTDWTPGITTQRDGHRATDEDLSQDPHEFRNHGSDALDADEDVTVEPGRTKMALARTYWDQAIAAGRRPTGKELAEASGASDRMGRKWIVAWAAEAGLDVPVSGSPINGAHVAYVA